MGSPMAARKTGHLQPFYRPVNAKYTRVRWSADLLMEHDMGALMAHDTTG